MNAIRVRKRGECVHASAANGSERMTDEPESFDELSAAQNRAAQKGSDAVSSVAKHAQRAMDSAKDFVAGANLDDLRTQAAETASNLYRGGSELLAGNEDLSKAADNLSAAVRKNPLAAVGIAFSAGLLLALLTRG
jgi:ElaB/YqjD/DUF883 family membrane-anchored ribosome-binding protein